MFAFCYLIIEMDIDEIRRQNIVELEKRLGAPYLVNKTGMSPAQYYNLRDGAKDSKTGKRRGMRKGTARRIEIAGGVPPGWLDTPHQETEGNKTTSESPNQTEQPSSESVNVCPGPDLRGKVPLISWVQAGAFCEAIDNLHPGDAYEWIDTSVQTRTYTFALRVQGDSMEPLFPAGIIVVVEPDMEPLPGDYVIAKNGDEEATFKQLVKDGADWYLKPLNPRYPIKPLSGSRIVGVVRASEQRFR